MLSDEAPPAIAPRRASSRNYWAISLHRLLRKKVGIACLTIILLMYGSGILAPLVTPYGYLSFIHISEPTRPRLISYAVLCLKK